MQSKNTLRHLSLSFGFLALILIFFAPGKAEAFSCGSETGLKIIARDPAGAYIPGIEVELYRQINDANGLKRPGKKLVSAKADKNTGAAIMTLKSIPEDDEEGDDYFVLHIKTGNKGESGFWYYDLSMHCGFEKEIQRRLSGISFILRDSDGNLLYDQKVKLYSQAYDADGRPAKQADRLIADLSTGKSGSARVFLPQGSVRGQNSSDSDFYILEFSRNGRTYELPNIRVSDGFLTFVEFYTTALKLSLRYADGRPATGTSVDVYQQGGSTGSPALGKKVGTMKTDNGGNGSLSVSAGTYALAIKDSLKREDLFFGIQAGQQGASKAEITLNSVRIDYTAAAAGATLDIYPLVGEEGGYYKGNKLGSFKTASDRSLRLHLAPGYYLASNTNKEKVEYGVAFRVEKEKNYRFAIKVDNGHVIASGEKVRLTSGETGINSSGEKRLAGRILLQVEAQGQAWYVNPKDLRRYYLSNGAAAFGIMRSAGIGASDADLRKIPIGVDSRFAGRDTDGDLLSDALEEAVGTDPFKADSDGDGFDDGEEFRSGFDPRGGGKLNTSQSFADKQKGKILIQVERKGEAWYVNPADGKRYYLGNGDLAYQIMRYLSIGISNKDLETVTIGN